MLADGDWAGEGRKDDEGGVGQGAGAADIELIVAADARIGAVELDVETGARGESDVAAGQDAGAVAGRDKAVGGEDADRAGTAQRGSAIHHCRDLRLVAIDDEIAWSKKMGRAGSESVVAIHCEGPRAAFCEGVTAATADAGHDSVEGAAAANN